jgi:four helix bundle protein
MSTFKFENLEVWKISVELNDAIYGICELLPKKEDFNLKNQILRASTSICLNIAEGSTCTSNAEQIRYLRIALHSTVEVVACMRLIHRRSYLKDLELYNKIDEIINLLFAKLNAFIKSLT